MQKSFYNLKEIDRNKKYSEPSTWNNYKINHPDLNLSCERLKHSPYVCNGCKSRSGCRKIRWTYYARESQKSYEELIKSCRQGVNLTLEEIHTINETITPLVKKVRQLIICTLIILIFQISVKVLFIVILKMEFLNLVLQIFIISLFQIILTDNGHEFFDVSNIECIHSTGEYVTHLFFCDPHASSQKGSIEKNYEFISYILPKGSSFKNITQEDCNLIMNNINSLCRDSLNSKSPYEAMLFLCNEDILKLLNCYYIEPDNVNLSNNLLK